MKFTGTIKIDHRARIETEQGILTLIPYPEDAPIEKHKKEWMGKELFDYLKNKVATVSGELSGKRIFEAQLVAKKFMTKDYIVAPESKDRFAQQIEEVFHKDSQQIAHKLNMAGIMTVSAFYHRIKDDYKPEVSAFSQYLEVPGSAIDQFLKVVEEDNRNRALVTAPPKSVVTRGINIKALARATGVPVKKKASALPPAFPPGEATPNLPSEIDLTARVTKVKDQGRYRGTCVAHAAAALLEFELINRGPHKRSLDLSEQYLYWGCKQIDGAPDDEGTFIEYAVEVLKNGAGNAKYSAGVCKESIWPYQLVSLPGNESQGPPLKGVSSPKTLKYTIKKYIRLNPKSIKDLKTALANSHCVGLSVYTYHFWTDGYVWREGVISLPFRIKPDGAHAICLVGYKDSDATHTDGHFIFKNSWGNAWGAGRPDPGFGSLPYRYVIGEGIEAWIVEV